MAKDIDYQTRVILNMDYSKEIAKARADAAANGQGIQTPSAAAASAWNPPSASGASVANAAVPTGFAPPITATQSYSAASAAPASVAEAKKPSFLQRILKFLGLGD